MSQFYLIVICLFNFYYLYSITSFISCTAALLAMALKNSSSIFFWALRVSSFLGYLKSCSYSCSIKNYFCYLLLF